MFTYLLSFANVASAGLTLIYFLSYKDTGQTYIYIYKLSY